MAGDLIVPNVQSKKYPVHGSWIKFMDIFFNLDWSKAVEYIKAGKGKGKEKGESKGGLRPSGNCKGKGRMRQR